MMVRFFCNVCGMMKDLDVDYHDNKSFYGYCEGCKREISIPKDSELRDKFNEQSAIRGQRRC